MVGRLLHDNVARFEVNGLVVEHHIDLARHDDGVVNRACAVHQRIGDRNATRGRSITHHFHHEIGIHFRQGRVINRRKFDDLDHRAVSRRRDAERPLAGVVL